MILKRNLKLNEVGEAGTALKNIEVSEIYSVHHKADKLVLNTLEALQVRLVRT